MKSSDMPKYLQLKEFIKLSIESGELKPGEKIYSENELAVKFKISRHTIRQAIGEMVNEGWLYRVKGSGTFVSRHIGRQKERSRTIGVVTTYLDDYIFPSIIKGIDGVLVRNGYSIILGYTNNKVEKEAACLANMLERNVDAFIVETTKSALPSPNLEIYNDIRNKGIPVVFINGYYAELDCSYVIVDDEYGGYMAADHLFKLGHHSIAGIFKSDDIQGHKRYKGFVKAHREREIPLKERAIMWFTTEDFETMSDEALELAFINRMEGCSAVVCYNDQIAVKVLDILRKREIKVPDEMSIVSFDDSEIGNAGEIKLTSIAHPRARLGEMAAEGLLEILNLEKEKIRIVMKPQFVLKNSTKAKS